MNRFWIIFCVLALTSALAVADVYKWVDARGKVQYSDSPPANTKATKVNIEDPVAPGANSTPPPSADFWKQKDKEFRERQDAKNKILSEQSQKITEEQADKRKKTCEFLKKDLAQVQSTRQRVIRRADGEIISDPNSAGMSNTQRSVAIGQLNDAIAKNCN
ncbi:MAG: DUF4124 domain-containing protein [Burkholderiales bacterium]